MEAAQKALEAEQEKAPRQEQLNRELGALEAELPRYQELRESEASLAALAERITELEEKKQQQAEEQQAKAQALHIWKQELGALAPVETERERLEPGGGEERLLGKRARRRAAGPPWNPWRPRWDSGRSV